MASQINIINVALARIGVDPITSLEDRVKEAVVAGVLWDSARRATLRDHFWNFAITSTTLAQIASVDTTDFAFAYQLPANCIRVVGIAGNPYFKIQGRRILTDSPTCRLRYVADITDTSSWDPSFEDVMAQRLAAEMAYALNKSQASADSMFAIYDRKLKIARHIDSTEDVIDDFGNVDSTLIGART